MSTSFNDIAMGVLSAALFAFGGKVLVDNVSHPHAPEKAAYTLPLPKGGGEGGAGAAAAKFDPKAVLALLPKANADAGEDTFRKCATCHTNNKGGENKVGPNLWGVVNRPVASVAGFDYSAAMKGKGGNWSWDAITTYLHDPKEAVPNNKMAFAGVDDAQDLADLLAYLRKLADAPPELPK